VLVLKGHRTAVRNESFAGATDLPPPPRAATVRAKPSVRRSRLPLGRPTRDVLDKLLVRGQIDQAVHDARIAIVTRALRTVRKLTGTRKTQLGAVLANADAMALGGSLTASRLEAVFETIDRNREWWTNGPLLSYGRRVGFSGSQLIWQYYPGQGIQLQMLGNFGKLNALAASKRRKAAVRQMADELVPLASDRAGAPVWEYYFSFDGGAPPWTSGMSQGTAVQAMSRAGNLLADPALTDLAVRSLPLFERPPPTGVRVNDTFGAFYLIYSFAPGQRVLNGHLQAVIGLYDLATLTGNPRAQSLYAAGEAEARAIVPRYDTGKWSLYDQSTESDLGYHQLVTTFLENLCKRNGEAVYCDTAARFKGYESEPPAVRATTARIRTGRPARIGFKLDKISRVGVTVRRRSGGTTVFSTSAVVGRGSRYFTWSSPAKPGLYDLTVTATDLAGNRAEPSQGNLRIVRR
jgi:hypothetical protein